MQPEQPTTTGPESANGPIEPAPPVVRPVRRGRRPMTRLVRAVLVAFGVALAAVFAAAASINPYGPNGAAQTMSTHTQLGLPPCNFAELAGKPCPSCGMTTSFALLVRGDVLNSLRANWVGTIICVVWAATLVWTLASGIRGRLVLIPQRPGAGETIFTAITGVIVILMLARWGALLIWD
ncbi:hypothetical protein GobsT_36140 [Gemmata obscuriglobus]|uniref:DUF2752 domain-containing protein n=1 Tax=Gemmata obscuriglobus TaxID=114 RepID=A0A2Z3H3G4_9BACT|nr:DUF2752 domain-containing protein [Gemmata obscuriglobus]AWM38267.1 DUF2752 domain-containing protein [Gemmata obscuriglobus]QEG28826.1 hypothetical protein GobsT_36140 [Gemmata obscuriglobus]VTS07223.1 Uncharacterized protein OS=Planctomyces limnophilus (strain ATCC 43296 / DSM 3776 / IFAM 1008 / 290) GN=Plim_1137 PE=4 SV=1: DUF2752 [Gemmata obscuriglobus UQM 2246]